jgi:hypothetical protein
MLDFFDLKIVKIQVLKIMKICNTKKKLNLIKIFVKFFSRCTKSINKGTGLFSLHLTTAQHMSNE